MAICFTLQHESVCAKLTAKDTSVKLHTLTDTNQELQTKCATLEATVESVKLQLKNVCMKKRKLNQEIQENQVAFQVSREM